MLDPWVLWAASLGDPGLVMQGVACKVALVMLAYTWKATAIIWVNFVLIIGYFGV